MPPASPALPAEEALPVEEALPALRAALMLGSNAVLVAPPGAGKTTRVPLALLGEPWVAGGRLIVLEPRRLAARAAATRMAATLGEAVGDTVGLRVRLDSRVSARTRIEVVTDGVFGRMILDDPGLDGVAGVVFDEVHERSLDADLGLAFALDAQGALREDLRLLPMSATLDGARVAALLGGAPVVESAGRAFPVETRYVGRDPRRPVEEAVAEAVLRALAEETGSVLAFLPGQGEIARTERLLAERVRDPSIDLAPLYGALQPGEQDRAVAPSPPGRRKVVLATSIAETSLTIEGVRVVVDSGLARVPRYEPDIGLTRLETMRVSRASADQRRGRAGRTGPGTCYRLWEAAATGALDPFSKPEILAADLSGLVIDCAAWGVTRPETGLRWLDAPPAPALAEARRLLVEIGAIDEDGRLSPSGRALSRLALPPRLGRMVTDGAAQGRATLASEIAAILTERGLGGDSTDLRDRVASFRRDQSPRGAGMRRLAASWARAAGGQSETGDTAEAGAVLALAYPDRVAVARGRPGAFTMESGRAAAVEPHDALAREPALVIAEVAGRAGSARILLAAPLDPDELPEVITDLETGFDPAALAVTARRVRRYRRLVLAEQPAPLETDATTALVLAEGIGRAGAIDRLPWSAGQQRLRERVRFMGRAQPDAGWPDLSDPALGVAAGAWLAPHVAGRRSLAAITAGDLDGALQALLPWSQRRILDLEAPDAFTAPTGAAHAIDYAAEGGPTVSVRVQELFGLAAHPRIAGGRLPLTFALLSPGHRPVQVTRDLPGFWAGSYAAVRAEMRGRYPRHPWPENPLAAPPTTRAKPRGT